MKHQELKYVDKIGCEIEGSWEKPPFDLIQDVSVRIDNATYEGEVNSPALYLEDMIKWIKQNTPSVVNHTCGLHVHLSIKKVKNYIRLMEKGFNEYFLKYMSDFGKKQAFPAGHQFWERLNDKNRFCRKTFCPDDQVNLRGKQDIRRTHLNYPYAMHGTIECRLFPGFNNSASIISCMEAFIDCVESYLDTTQDSIDETPIKIVVPFEKVDLINV